MNEAGNKRRILSVRGLSAAFHVQGRTARAVDGVDLEIHEGETVALVGESGCGKTATALSILKLLPSPAGRIEGGVIEFDGANLLDMPDRALRKIRGNRISMIFQEPMTCLNPLMRIGAQVAEVFRVHKGYNRARALSAAEGMLEQVGISAASTRVNEYPHQLSGGMKQRVMIAMALACDPALLIADEPTTAVDVTVQAQILSLLDARRKEYGMSILLISHDLSVVADLADRVYIMYASKIVETAPIGALFEKPLHPYTAGLFMSLPGLNRSGRRLREIPGAVPDPMHFPSGCRFHPRCHWHNDRCKVEEPELGTLEAERRVACHYPLEKIKVY